MDVSPIPKITAGQLAGIYDYLQAGVVQQWIADSYEISPNRISDYLAGRIPVIWDRPGQFLYFVTGLELEPGPLAYLVDDLTEDVALNCLDRDAQIQDVYEHLLDHGASDAALDAFHDLRREYLLDIHDLETNGQRPHVPVETNPHLYRFGDVEPEDSQ